MTPKQVDAILKDYRFCVARRTHLKLRIEEYRRLIQEETKRGMEAEAVRTQTLTGLPRGSGLSSPVEALVEKYIEGYVPPLAQSLMNEKETLEREYEEAGRRIRYAEGWLQCLTPRERIVVEKQMLEGLQWGEVERAAEAAFGYPLSRAGLKRVKERALKQIYRVACDGEQFLV